MVEKLTLDNGVRVLHEHLEHVRSCAIGFWVENGSCHEPGKLNGISHFIEHMLFKGTETRSAADLAQAFDTIGGQVNAFTTKEYTCYHARVLDTHVQQVTDLLYDMYAHSAFRPADVKLERGVIVEEIGMYEDTPEDLVNELIAPAIFPDQPLGRPILGSEQTLQGIGSEELRAYCAAHYCGRNTIVSISGSYSQQDLKMICAALSQLPAGEHAILPPASYQKAIVVRKKEIEQNHLQLIYPGIVASDPQRYVLAALNNILGAGMSSRLFQSVREQSGMCYSIYSFTSLYERAGALGVYVALGKETERAALELIRDEIERFRQDGVTEDELQRTKEQLKSSLLMALESTNARMSSMARSEITFGHYQSPEQTVARLEAVTCDDILQLSRKLLDPAQLSFSAVGEVEDEDTYLSYLR